jgi:isopentenyl phosphate kinase
LTADQLAWAYYTDVNTTADHGTLSRITFSTVASQSPLSVVNHHASAAVIATSTASWRPLVVVIGRGRHFGKNHARELSLQLAKQNQAPTVAAEIRKTVGDVATAMITSGMQAASASFLVVQAATSSPQKDS